MAYRSEDGTRASKVEADTSPGCEEGDMLLSPEQEEEYLAMQRDAAENRTRRRRDASNPFHLWPNGVLVYQYEPGLSESDVGNVSRDGRHLKLKY